MTQQLTLKFLFKDKPANVDFDATTFSSSQLGGGAVIIGPIRARSQTPVGVIPIDAVVVTSAKPASDWSKIYKIKLDEGVFQPRDGSTLTVVFHPSDVTVVVRSAEDVAAMRGAIASIP